MQLQKATVDGGFEATGVGLATLRRRAAEAGQTKAGSSPS